MARYGDHYFEVLTYTPDGTRPARPGEPWAVPLMPLRSMLDTTYYAAFGPPRALDEYPGIALLVEPPPANFVTHTVLRFTNLAGFAVHVTILGRHASKVIHDMVLPSGRKDEVVDIWPLPHIYFPMRIEWRRRDHHASRSDDDAVGEDSDNDTELLGYAWLSLTYEEIDPLVTQYDRPAASSPLRAPPTEISHPQLPVYQLPPPPPPPLGEEPSPAPDWIAVIPLGRAARCRAAHRDTDADHSGTDIPAAVRADVRRARSRNALLANDNTLRLPLNATRHACHLLIAAAAAMPAVSPAPVTLLVTPALDAGLENMTHVMHVPGAASRSC
ncbi:hypothetical protein H9P43_000221 [Blastocladiella emersonii ATCC 22665]|nr:hypothetical protein H9P43_000221 [Blastocladiella emersonii ATCC 22665]